jgi:hypothetical protein
MRIDRLMSTVWRGVDMTERCVQTSINGHERALLRDERAQLLYGAISNASRFASVC